MEVVKSPSVDGRIQKTEYYSARKEIDLEQTINIIILLNKSLWGQLNAIKYILYYISFFAFIHLFIQQHTAKL